MVKKLEVEQLLIKKGYKLQDPQYVPSRSSWDFTFDCHMRKQNLEVIDVDTHWEEIRQCGAEFDFHLMSIQHLDSNGENFVVVSFVDMSDLKRVHKVFSDELEGLKRTYFYVQGQKEIKQAVERLHCAKDVLSDFMHDLEHTKWDRGYSHFDKSNPYNVAFMYDVYKEIFEDYVLSVDNIEAFEEKRGKYLDWCGFDSNTVYTSRFISQRDDLPF